MKTEQADPRLAALKKAIAEHQRATVDLGELFEKARSISNNVTIKKLRAGSHRVDSAWRVVRQILDAV